MAHSPYSLLSRSRELNSPLSFSLPPDSENKIPKVLSLLASLLASVPSLSFPSLIQGNGAQKKKERKKEIVGWIQIWQTWEKPIEISEAYIR